MTTLKLITLIIAAKNKKEISQILNEHRVPIHKSKYC